MIKCDRGTLRGVLMLMTRKETVEVVYTSCTVMFAIWNEYWTVKTGE